MEDAPAGENFSATDGPADGAGSLDSCDVVGAGESVGRVSSAKGALVFSSDPESTKVGVADDVSAGAVVNGTTVGRVAATGSPDAAGASEGDPVGPSAAPAAAGASVVEESAAAGAAVLAGPAVGAAGGRDGAAALEGEGLLVDDAIGEIDDA